MLIRDTELIQADGSFKAYISDIAFETPTSREFQTFRDVVVFTNTDSVTLTIDYDPLQAPIILEAGESATVQQAILQYNVSGRNYSMETFRLPIFNRGVVIDLSLADYPLTYTAAHVEALIVSVGHATNAIIVPDALLPNLINKVYVVSNQDLVNPANIKSESGLNTVVVAADTSAFVRVNQLATEVERGTTNAPHI